MVKRPKIAIEFFAGIGLMRMGLEQADWRVAYANDIDPLKEKMYKDHFGGKHRFDLGDIHSIPTESLPRATLATASFPCNDLSLAGKRKGLEGDNSSAFWGLVRILNELGEDRPPLVMLENVPGFLSSRDGEDLQRALMALNDLEYGVDAFMVDAAAFVPQSRRRLFIVAEQASAAEMSVSDCASNGCSESATRPPALVGFIRGHPEIDWNIRELPPPPKRFLRLEDIIEEIDETSELWWNQERSDYLLNQMSERHRAKADDMIKGSEWAYGTVFRRVRKGRSMAELRTDGIAGCLRTPRGGSGRQIVVRAGKSRLDVRLLTGTECARLMGADDYRFDVSPNQALFGFGDAVCVPVIKWIAENYLNRLCDLNPPCAKSPLIGAF